jgi:hypothetical protein
MKQKQTLVKKLPKPEGLPHEFDFLAKGNLIVIDFPFGLY